MNSERRDGLDPILDGALRDYSNREPRTGFEQRVLGRIQSSRPMRRSSWWIGWVLVPVLMAAIILSAITAGNDRPKAQPLPPITRVAQSPGQPLAPAPVRKAARVIGKRGKLPELDSFPEPEPLTAGERALLGFARSEPEQARELVADLAQVKALTIDPLKIEELQ
jgi:hypothetical protein